MRQKKRCPLAEDILKNFPGDSVFLYPNLGRVPATGPKTALGRNPASDAMERIKADCVIAVKCQINAICKIELVRTDTACPAHKI